MAAQMKCPNCGSIELVQVDNDQFECPYCGKSCTRAEAEVAVAKAAKAETVKNVKKGISKIIIGAIVLAALVLVAIIGWNMKKEADAKAYAESPEGKAEAAALAAQQEFDAVTAMPVEKLSVTLDKGPNSMPSNSFETYYPKNIIDGNRSTAWGSTGGNKGEFVFNLSCKRLDHIIVWNGHWGESGWSDNARVRQFILRKDDGSGHITEIGPFDLNNKFEAQTIYFGDENPDVRDIKVLTIELNGRYAGSLFDDVYISEIEFYGCK